MRSCYFLNTFTRLVLGPQCCKLTPPMVNHSTSVFTNLNVVVTVTRGRVKINQPHETQLCL